MKLRFALVGVVAIQAASPFALAGPPPAAPVQERLLEAPDVMPDATASGGLDSAPASAEDDLPLPPVPPRIAEGAPYEACMAMLANDPSGADAAAASMAAGAGGTPGAGEAAAHCHALAQVELGNTEAGATLLDRLASSSHAPPEQRAEVFGQASQAWTMAGRIGQAFASADQAVTLSPDDPDLRIGRAIAALAQHRFAEAADDLTRVLDGDPKRTDALVLRATANRNLGRLAQAAADVDAAAAQDADNPDALLERGIVRQRTGDLAGARADWERTADLGANTPTGDLAQQNLALLQAGPPQ